MRNKSKNNKEIIKRLFIICLIILVTDLTSVNYTFAVFFDNYGKLRSNPAATLELEQGQVSSNLCSYLQSNTKTHHVG
jgi:hypothetical protein